MEHTLRIKERFFEQILNKEKTFEIRYNDRWFQKWDTIKFQLIDWLSDFDKIFPKTTLEIVNVFQEKWFWLEEWYCILSFKLIKKC